MRFPIHLYMNATLFTAKLRVTLCLRVICSTVTCFQLIPTASAEEPKAYEIVDRAYRAELGRPPDPAGLKVHVEELMENDRDEAWLRNVLRESEEAQKNKIYARRNVLAAGLSMLLLGVTAAAAYMFNTRKSNPGRPEPNDFDAKKEPPYRFSLRFRIMVFFVLMAGALLCLFIWRPAAVSQNWLVFTCNMIWKPMADWGATNERQDAMLFFLLAHFLGVRTPSALVRVCFVINFFSMGLFLNWTMRNYGARMGFLACCVFITHPVFYILFSWLGLADGLTVLSTIIMVMSGHAWLSCLGAGIAVFNHHMGAPIAASVLGLRWLSQHQRISIQHLGWGAAGTCAGKLSAMISNSLSEGSGYSRLSFILDSSITKWMEMQSREPLGLLYSLFLTYWLPVLCMCILYMGKRKRFFGFYLICLLGFMMLGFITVDTTRVFVLLSWGPTFICLLEAFYYSQGEASGWRRRTFRFSILAAMVFSLTLPPFQVARGRIQRNSVDEMHRVLSLLAGGDGAEGR